MHIGGEKKVTQVTEEKSDAMSVSKPALLTRMEGIHRTTPDLQVSPRDQEE